MPWTNAITCDDCWRRLFDDRTPVRLKNPPTVPCYFCDKPTNSGIYARVFVSATEPEPTDPFEG